MASFYNPIVFIGERGKQDNEKNIIKPCYKMPFSELDTLSSKQIAKKQENQEAFVFGHSLTDLIDGQTKIGFNIVDFYEDWQPKPRFVIDNFLPTFLATLAVKKVK